MARLSGLQRDVLSLYRKCLREAKKKPLVRGLTTINGDQLGTDMVSQDVRTNFLDFARYAYLVLPL